MKRFLIKLVVLVLIIAVAAVVTDALFTRIFRSGDVVKAQWLMKHQEGHYDVVILGNSRAWWNIDMNAIDRECSMRSLNLANNHFSPLEILLSFKLFIQNGNRADLVLMQVDPRNITAGPPEFSSTTQEFLPWLEEAVVDAHFQQLADREWQLMRHIPFLRYGRYNFKWGPEQVLVTLAGLRKPLFDHTGSYFVDHPYRGSGVEFDKGTRFHFNEEFQQIAELCREHGMRLELFTAPYYRLGIAEVTTANFLSTIEATGLPHHDFTHSIDSTIYFIDNRHLNPLGGSLFTSMLIKEVVCPDRSDPAPAVPDEGL
jgi:hypothetical protein